MDKIIDDIVAVLIKNLQKEGQVLDANMQKVVKENLKAQLMNLPEQQRNEVLGLIASQLPRG